MKKWRYSVFDLSHDQVVDMSHDFWVELPNSKSPPSYVFVNLSHDNVINVSRDFVGGVLSS